MATIVTDQLQKNHCAPILSRTFLVSGTLSFVAFLLPLILVAQTHNFWVNTATYFEQPNVTHLNEIVVFLYTDTNVYTFASTQALNDLLENSSEDASSLSPSFQVSYSFLFSIFFVVPERGQKWRW